MNAVLAALALVIAPVDAPLPPCSTYTMRLGQEVALAFEVLDSRELKYVLSKEDEYKADALLVRRRYAELFDAPPLADSLRFPERATINECLAFNRKYKLHVEARKQVMMTLWWELRGVVQQTDHLYKIWDTARDARCDYYYVSVRREALKKLRGFLGTDAYYRGQLPPFVPLEVFEQLR